MLNNYYCLAVSELLIAPHLNATLIPPHARSSGTDAQTGGSGGQSQDTSNSANPGGDASTSQGAVASGGNA